MKKMMAMAALVSAMVLGFSSVSMAAQLCGELESHAVGPRCVEGQPCAHWIELQFTITDAQGQNVLVHASDMQVLQSFSQLNGRQVCAEGHEGIAGFYVTSIAAQN